MKFIFQVDDIDTWGWMDIHYDIEHAGVTDHYDEFKTNRISNLPKWDDSFDQCRSASNAFTSNGFFTWDPRDETTKPTHYYPLPPRKVQYIY